MAIVETLPEYDGKHEGHSLLHRIIETRLTSLEKFVEAAQGMRWEMRDIKWLLVLFFFLALPRFVESIKALISH